MKRLWELVLLMLILGVMFKVFVDTITPLMPYMMVALLIILVAGFVYQRNRNW